MTFPFDDFFHLGETKKKSLGVRSGEWGGCSPGVKVFLASTVWAGALVNHPSQKGKPSTVFRKNSLEPNIAFHNNAGW